jgi:hypothetical protein
VPEALDRIVLAWRLWQGDGQGLYTVYCGIPTLCTLE